MRESCFCGRSGEIESRAPFQDDDGGQALQRPGCGHLDYLQRLPDDARFSVLEESERRRRMEHQHESSVA